MSTELKEVQNSIRRMVYLASRCDTLVELLALNQSVPDAGLIENLDEGLENVAKVSEQARSDLHGLLERT